MDIKENEENAARMRRMQRIQKMQDEKQKQMMRRMRIRQYAPYVTGAAALLLIVFLGIQIVHKTSDKKDTQVRDNNEVLQDQEIASVAVNDSKVIHSMVTPGMLGGAAQAKAQTGQEDLGTGPEADGPAGSPASSKSAGSEAG